MRYYIEEILGAIAFVGCLAVIYFIMWIYAV